MDRQFADIRLNCPACGRLPKQINPTPIPVVADSVAPTATAEKQHPATATGLPPLKDTVTLPDTAKAMSPRALVYAGIALIETSDKDYQDPLPARYFTTAIERDHHLNLAYERLGAFYWEQRDRARKTGIGDPWVLENKCLAVYTEQLKYEPNWADAYYSRINVYNSLGRFGEAEADAAKLLAMRPEMNTVRATHGYILHELHRPKEAAAELEQCLNSKDLASLNILAQCYEEMHQYKKAIEFTSKWLKQSDSKDDGLLRIRARCERELGKYH